MYTPDGIMGSTLILCYLSEVGVLKLASAVLYLECRPLDMHTDAPEWDAGRMSRRQNGTAAEIRRGL